MKEVVRSLLFCSMLLPALAAEKPRVMFGVVSAAAPEGVVVQAVHPASPARDAGLQVGDVIVALNGAPVHSREEMRAVLRTQAPGNVLAVETLQNGKRRVLQITLAERPVRKDGGAANPGAAVGGDRMLRPLVVEPSIRKAMRERRQQVVAQLAALPAGLVPAEVTEHLQAIRHLARDANPQGRGWMLGEAGEVTLQFKDAAGILVLHGANKQLVLMVYDAAGALTHTLPLNTAAERAAVPQQLIERLRNLR